MTGINHLDAATRDDIIQRLKRIEGQARGIQRMVEDGRDCQDIMNQIMAMRAATDSLNIELLEQAALHCLRNAEEYGSPDQAVAQMVGFMSRLIR